MRRLELSASLPADADTAWALFLDTTTWPDWGRLVTSAEGEFTAGARWTMRLSGGRTMRPFFVEQGPRTVTFETLVGAASLVRMVHRFDVEPADSGSVLRQTFEATGALVPLLWPILHRGMAQFDAMGDDLAAALSRS